MSATVRARFGAVAVGVAAWTLASRIVGFGRSIVFSKTVGDTCLGDAYNAANTLPNVLFEIVAGGVLAGVVVPVVARHLGSGRDAAASRTASALLTWTLLVLTPPAVAAFLGANAYAQALAKPTCPGSAGALAALLVLFVPQVWLYGVAVVTAGILQAHSRFLAAAAAPLLSSLVVISAYLSYALVAGPGAADDLTLVSRRALAVLGVGTTLGVLALAATTAVAVARLGLRLRPRLRFAAGDRQVVISVALAGLAGLVLQQLATLEIAYLTSRTPDPGAFTRFVWANAIYLLPYAVLVAPLLQLVFPRLSVAAGQGGPEAVARVLDRFGPPIGLLACLGAALLVAAAVPVARVFVLGPGSGRTTALAVPIAVLAPAVVGFGLLGLATRTLLASHHARAAGVATAVAWGTVIVAALLAGLLVPDGWLVPALAAAVSLGMVAGAVCGWLLVTRAARDAPLQVRTVVGRPLRSGLPAAGLAGGLGAWATAGLTDAGLRGASLGALAVATAAAALFLGVVAVIDRPLLTGLLALRGGPPEPERG